MARIGIVGNYGHNNNGDEAILSGLIKQIKNELPDVKITIFSNNPQDSNNRYGYPSYSLIHKKGNFLSSVISTITQTYREMKRLDLVIVGGGGILMDMYFRDAPLYATFAMLAKAAGAKVVYYAVGAGPITTGLGKLFIRLGLKCAQNITVRDEESKKLLERLGFNNIKVTADPAFGLRDEEIQTEAKMQKRVGVTAVPYFSKSYWSEHNESKYRNYKEKMALICDHLISKYNYEVHFFATKYPEDMLVTEEIKKIVINPDRVLIHKENLIPQQIIELNKEFDFIIGTRLHSLILSMVSGKPVIGVAYHKKVKDFINQIDLNEYVLNIDEINEERVADVIAKLIVNRQDVANKINAKASEMRSIANKNAKVVASIVKGEF